MDKWQKLKDFLAEGKQNIPKDLLVSKSIFCEEILDIMEELEKREFSERREQMINDGMLKCDRCGKELRFCDKFRPVWRSDSGEKRILCIKCYGKFPKQIKKFYDDFFTSYTEREKGK